MSGLDYSTFSLCSALASSQPTPARSYPVDPIQQHVAEDVIDSHICNLQRDDLPSSSEITDRPSEDALMLSSPYQREGAGHSTFVFPRPSLQQSDPVDDVQGNKLCDQLGGFHFTPTYGSSRGHGTVDEPVNTPTAIMETSNTWNSHHSLQYPAPVRGSISHSIKGAGNIPEDARPGLTTLYCDVTTRVPARSASMAMTDPQLGGSYDFGLPSPLPCMAMDVSTFLPGGAITSPSPPPTAYHENNFPGADSTYELASHYSLDRTTVPSLDAFQQNASHQALSLDHRFAPAMASTPFPGLSPSQPPHDHPVCDPPLVLTSFLAEELPRPGSAPPLIDNEVPFVGDVRAVLQTPLDITAANDVHRQYAWSTQPAALGAGQSPRSSPKRAGSIGHNAQKTPPNSRHLRRWSSVTNPALRASPPYPPPVSPNGVPFPRYPPPCGAPDNAYGHFSPYSESESDEVPPSAYPMPHAAAGVVAPVNVVPMDPHLTPQPDAQPTQHPQHPASTPLPMRNVIRCDGHLIDEESWSTALTRPDKLVHVYECFWDSAHSPCGMWIEGDQSSVADHLALFHGFRGGEVTTRCLWRDCPRPHMKGTSIARHVVTHIGFRVKCHTCKHEFARVDACNRAHNRSGCLGVGQPMFGDLQRVLDARRVDPLHRPSKKRRTDD